MRLGPAFPEFTIRGIVPAQHRSVIEELGLQRLHAVSGLSLGGYPTYERVTTYPDFMERAVSVVATPGRFPSENLGGGGVVADWHVLNHALDRRQL